jgi:hypothetical protein
MTDEPNRIQPASISTQRGRFDACLERRNRMEFIAGGVAIVVLIVSGAVGFAGSENLPDMIAALGLMLVAAGLGATLWRLSRHVAVQKREVPGASPKAALVDRLRRELDLLRSVWGWYIGPMLPGLVLVWGAMFAGGSTGTALAGTVTTIAALAWVVHANRRTAAELDSQLRELEPAAR